MADANSPIKFVVAIILGVIAINIGMTTLVGQAPVVGNLTATTAGSSLAIAGITSASMAGQVYSYVNVFWALAVFALPVGFALALLGKAKGWF